MDKHLVAYYIGIAIVFGTHLFMLTKSVNNHAIINLIGALLIAYYFTNKEGFIKF